MKEKEYVHINEEDVLYFYTKYFKMAEYYMEWSRTL